MSTVLNASESDLLSRLKIIKANNFEVHVGINPFSLVEEVVNNLGCLNPELRDDFGYTLLAHWIYRQKLFAPQQLLDLLSRFNSEKMWFNNIGVGDSPSVFLRSFTSLGINLLLRVDAVEPFMNRDTWEHLLIKTVDYCNQERDLRGYVNDNGWAHAAAHVADVLNTFAQHPKFTYKHTLKIMTALRMIMDNSQTVFIHEEDERIAQVLVSLCKNGHLTFENLSVWFENADCNLETYMESMQRRIIWKNLYRSLLVQLSSKNLFRSFDDPENKLVQVAKKFEPYRT